MTDAYLRTPSLVNDIISEVASGAACNFSLSERVDNKRPRIKASKHRTICTALFKTLQDIDRCFGLQITSESREMLALRPIREAFAFADTRAPRHGSRGVEAQRRWDPLAANVMMHDENI